MKKNLQNLTKTSKFDLYEKTFFNQSKNVNQFWHRYEKSFENKKDVIEPMYDVSSQNYIFKDEIILSTI